MPELADPLPITEQDVQRLTAVVVLYSEVEPDDAAELLRLLGRAKTMPASKVPRTSVTMNSRLLLRDDDAQEREVSLVYPWDAGRERISVLSELGRALLGAEVGARVSDGKRKLRIDSIPYQPEAAGDHHL